MISLQKNRASYGTSPNNGDHLATCRLRGRHSALLNDELWYQAHVVSSLGRSGRHGPAGRSVEAPMVAHPGLPVKQMVKRLGLPHPACTLRPAIPLWSCASLPDRSPEPAACLNAQLWKRVIFHEEGKEERVCPHVIERSRWYCSHRFWSPAVEVLRLRPGLHRGRPALPYHLPLHRRRRRQRLHHPLRPTRRRPLPRRRLFRPQQSRAEGD